MTDDASRSSGVGRKSLAVSAGTLCAKIFGFGRNLALSAAIGTGLVADSYNIANQLPNQLFYLLGGTSIAYVFVPQLIRHARVSTERSDEYGSLLIFAGAIFGFIVTALLIAFSPLIIRSMGGSSWGEAQSALGLRLSLWCMPQIFFYVLYEVAAQLMNARGRFNAVAWMPIANSIVVILACIPLIAVGTIEANSPGSVTAREVALLGGSTLIGSMLQSVFLIVLLRRANFRLRFRFHVRGLGLRATAAGGSLAVLASVCYQFTNLVTAALSTQAGSAAKLLGFDGRGYTAILYAQTLLYLAQAVAAVGLSNILLQRLSKHYSNGDDAVASKELNEAVLAIGALLIPVMSLFICLGPLGTELLFTRGETSSSAARFVGVVLAVLAVGLVPYALHSLLIRPFYAVFDARTPLRSAVIVGAVWLLGSFAASRLLPPEWVLLGIAAAFSLAYLIDLPLKLISLNRRLGFRLSGVVIRGYCWAFGAAVVAAGIVGVSTMYVDQLLPLYGLSRIILFLGGVAGFLAIYYPLTARSSTSMGRLVQWLRS